MPRHVAVNTPCAPATELAFVTLDSISAIACVSIPKARITAAVNVSPVLQAAAEPRAARRVLVPSNASRVPRSAVGSALISTKILGTVVPAVINVEATRSAEQERAKLPIRVLVARARACSTAIRFLNSVYKGAPATRNVPEAPATRKPMFVFRVVLAPPMRLVCRKETAGFARVVQTTSVRLRARAGNVICGQIPLG